MCFLSAFCLFTEQLVYLSLFFPFCFQPICGLYFKICVLLFLGCFLYTFGQKAKLRNCSNAWFVVDKNIASGEVFVVSVLASVPFVIAA